MCKLLSKFQLFVGRVALATILVSNCCIISYSQNSVANYNNVLLFTSLQISWVLANLNGAQLSRFSGLCWVQSHTLWLNEEWFCCACLFSLIVFLRPLVQPRQCHLMVMAEAQESKPNQESTFEDSPSCIITVNIPLRKFTWSKSEAGNYAQAQQEATAKSHSKGCKPRGVVKT